MVYGQGLHYINMQVNRTTKYDIMIIKIHLNKIKKVEYKMSLFYRSTRDDNVRVTASQAILKGLAPDGGLFVPESIPSLDKSLEELSKMSYKEVAYEVMKLMLDDFTEEELKNCIDKAYDSKFDTEEIAPLVKAEGAYYLELFHGATIAFKDMALSILPHLLTTSAKKNDVKNEIVILTATSGDTGKAALAGFADVPGTRIVVFYPKNGVSPIQEKQMVTQKGANTHVIGIKGNFDDAQTGVKNIFGDKELEKVMNNAGFQFSSANSKNMGLPINKLICASNENKVLYDFFTTGEYDRNREFVLTTSPSMDILISSNLERLIYRIAGNNAGKNKELMDSLKTTGKYEITEDMKAQLSDFYGNYATEAEDAATIKELYETCGYVIDTHTAVAAAVYNKYKADTNDDTKTVIASTASPYKFTRSVMEAIDPKYAAMGDFELVDKLSELAKVKVPNAIEEIRTAPVLHNTVCEVNEMTDEVKKFLGI